MWYSINLEPTCVYLGEAGAGAGWHSGEQRGNRHGPEVHAVSRQPRSENHGGQLHGTFLGRSSLLPLITCMYHSLLCQCVCLSVCVYVCLSVCVCLCLCMCVCVCVCVCLCLCVYVFVCLCVCVCLSVCLCVSVCACVWMPLKYQSSSGLKAYITDLQLFISLKFNINYKWKMFSSWIWYHQRRFNATTVAGIVVHHAALIAVIVFWFIECSHSSYIYIYISFRFLLSPVTSVTTTTIVGVVVLLVVVVVVVVVTVVVVILVVMLSVFIMFYVVAFWTSAPVMLHNNCI